MTTTQQTGYSFNMTLSISPDKQGVWLASIQRARRDRVRLWHTKRWGWRAHSKGSKNIYTLLASQVFGDEIKLSCSCPAAGYRGYCKHLVVLAMRLDKKGYTVRLG